MVLTDISLWHGLFQLTSSDAAPLADSLQSPRVHAHAQRSMADLACQHGKARSNVKGARCSSSVPPCLIPKPAKHFEQNKEQHRRMCLENGAAASMPRQCHSLQGCACITYVKRRASTLAHYTDIPLLTIAPAWELLLLNVLENKSPTLCLFGGPQCSYPGSGLSNLCRQASEGFAKRPHHTSRSGARKCGLAEKGLLQMMQHHRCLWTLAESVSWDTISFGR